MDGFVTGLMDRMTVREKLGQLNLPSGGDLVTGTVMNGELTEMIRKQEITGFFNVKGVRKIREMQRIALDRSSAASDVYKRQVMRQYSPYRLPCRVAGTLSPSDG